LILVLRQIAAAAWVENLGCKSREELARARLERLGYTEIEIAPADDELFHFKAIDDTGRRCDGSVTVRVYSTRSGRVASLGWTNCHTPVGK
jgi:hypothetical protein